jgi:ADP-ribose pyrophosphatase
LVLQAMPSVVVVENEREIFKDFFTIKGAEVKHERFDGRMSDTQRLLKFERGDSVAALIYDKRRQRLILINQFRYPAHEKGPGWMTEVVAGMIKPEEDPLVALRREVREETGYELPEKEKPGPRVNFLIRLFRLMQRHLAGPRIERISTFYVSPGGSSERIHLYYAEVRASERKGLGGGLASEGEDIKLIELSVAQAEEQIRTGAIVDAKTIIGIMWLRNRLSGMA